MLDIELFRTNPKVIKESQKRRGKPIELVDEVIKSDEIWRATLRTVEDLRAEKNKLAIEIGEFMKAKKDASGKIKRSKELVRELEDLEKNVDGFKQTRDNALKQVPNILEKEVPQGNTDEDNVEIRHWGKIPKFSFKPKDHIDIGKDLDLFDTEKAGELAGSRFYFLRNELVKLDLAIALYAIDTLIDEGYTPIMPPNMIKYKVLEGAGYFPGSEEDTYKIEGEDLYLIGTSEQVMCALHSNETLEEKDLPKYYAGFSPCYRTEAGSHGRDTKGIFRVHQFEKVEQVKLCLPENSKKEHLHLIKTAEKLFQGLEIPYRIVDICTADMGYNAAARKFDLEVWLPGQGKYREAVSASNCTDYQARRLNTKVRRKDGTVQVVHTLNSTAIAIERCMIAILENFQQKDGSIKIPKVLWKYTGFKEIKPKKKK